MYSSVLCQNRWLHCWCFKDNRQVMKAQFPKKRKLSNPPWYQWQVSLYFFSPQTFPKQLKCDEIQVSGTTMLPKSFEKMLFKPN